MIVVDFILWCFAGASLWYAYHERRAVRAMRKGFDAWWDEVR